MLKDLVLPAGIQHTMCIQGVTFIRAAMEVLGPPLKDEKKTAPLAQKIERWTEECSVYLKNRRVSRGAERAMEAAFQFVGKHIDDAHGDEEKRMEIWAAVLSMGNLLILDSRRYGKAITMGHACWRYLDQTSATLVRQFAKINPEIETMGFEMYCKIQINGSEYRPKDADGNVIYELA